MNIYFLRSVGKLFSLLLVSITSLFNANAYGANSVNIENVNGTKNLNVYNKVVEYETIINYNDKRPSNITKVLAEGINGLVYVDSKTNEETVVKEVVNRVVEVGTGEVGEYTGRLTSYGADCPGCSAVGNVACFTRERKNHSLTYNGIYYNDQEYGEVRILAAALSKFPCGTIILVENTNVEPFYGVVLDTGYTMRQEWKEGRVWLDLAWATQADARVGGMSHRETTYTVQRWGW